MLHHSSSRHQRNRGSKIKIVLQVALLLGIVVWLLYQVKHSYDKKNEYLDDNEDQLINEDRSMFQGRKERAGNNNDANVDNHGENFDVISKPEEVGVDHLTDAFDQHDEDKSGTVFEKDNTESHEDDVGNIEKSEAKLGQVGNENGNIELHSNDGNEATDTEDAEHNPEFNIAEEQTGSRSEVHSTEEDVPQKDDHTHEGGSTGETNGRSHEEVAQGDESTNADQTNATNNGSDGEEAEKKEVIDSQISSESISDDAKIETTENAQNNVNSNGEHATETLPDETGNVPSVYNEDAQKYASENQGDAASTTSENTEHDTGEAVHSETGSQIEGTTSSGSDSQNEVVIPVDNEVPKREASESQSDNAVKANTSDNNSSEAKTATGSGNDENGAEMGASSKASDSERGNPQGDNAAAEVTSNNKAANVETDNSQGASDAEKVANNSSEETKPEENSNNGATESSHNGEQVDMKIETSISADGEHKESQGDGSSGSNNSTDNALEQTGKTEMQ